ncbi:MAG: zinc ribbon domain-containing protein [Bacteroidota bacterium]
MPTYTYKREDGSVFEIDQRITADALEVCPTTGQKVKRIISGGAGLVFKGSGFYLTDYGKSGSSAGNAQAKEKGSSGTSESTKGDTASSSSSNSDSGKSDASKSKSKPAKAE